MALMLTFTDSDLNFINLLFEAVSAFATVGMSAGIAPELSTLGQLILMFGMFIGRLGTFTVALALAQHTEVKAYRYVQERVTIG